jgi:hypothetical protein
MRQRLGPIFGTALIVVGALVMTTSAGPAAGGNSDDPGPPDPIPVGGVLSDASPGAGFTRTGDADPSRPLHLGIGLQRDNTALNGMAMAVATPGTPLWGQHRTVADVAASLSAPSPTAEAVTDFFADRGIDAWVDVTALYVHATPTVAQASAMSAVTLGDYTGPGAVIQTDYVAADTVPTVPPGLVGLVAEITGLTLSWPYTQPPSDTATSTSTPFVAAGLAPAPTNTGTPSGCADALDTGAYTPDQMVTACGLDDLASASGQRGEGAQLAVLIDGDGFAAETLAAYQSCFGLPPLNPISHLFEPAGYVAGLSGKLVVGHGGRRHGDHDRCCQRDHRRGGVERSPLRRRLTGHRRRTEPVVPPPAVAGRARSDR